MTQIRSTGPQPRPRRDSPAATLAESIHARLQGLPLQAPETEAGMMALLRVLYAAGREDLAFARLLEGHVDAVQTIKRTASPAQHQRLEAILADRATLGVWNADLRDAPLSLSNGRLFGGKAFASGAGLLSHALVTLHAGDRDRVQLLLLDLAATPPDIDRSWWNVVGMQQSETHLVRWNSVPFEKDWFVGAAGDYEREPWFSGGALRFVAAHAGGVAAIFDAVREHLQHTGRARNVHQAGRLATLYRCADLSTAVVRQAASAWFDQDTRGKLAAVAHARTTVCGLAEEAVMAAQQSVGLQSLFSGHPLATIMTNLMVYLRQPAPDAQRTSVGEAVADGLLRPDL